MKLINFILIYNNINSKNIKYIGVLYGSFFLGIIIYLFVLYASFFVTFVTHQIAFALLAIWFLILGILVMLSEFVRNERPLKLKKENLKTLKEVNDRIEIIMNFLISRKIFDDKENKNNQ